MSSSCLVGTALKWYHLLALYAGITDSYPHHAYSSDITDVVHVVGILSTARLEEVDMVV